VNILRTEKLCRSFGSLRAVNDISIEVPEHQVRAIIGSNGAGKTTLLDMITNRTAPTSGHVYYLEQDITKMPTYKIVQKGIGKCFQISKLFNRLSVYENIQIACICRNRKYLSFFQKSEHFLEKDVEQIMEMVRLKDKAREIAGFLSYGDQRKLEIGVTLALEPKLLMLDEPTAGISRTEGYDLMALVTSIVKQQGITVIFIEHDMDIVFDFAEHITVMHRGEYLASGTPEEVRNNPLVIQTYLGDMS